MWTTEVWRKWQAEILVGCSGQYWYSHRQHYFLTQVLLYDGDVINFRCEVLSSLCISDGLKIAGHFSLVIFHTKSCNGKTWLNAPQNNYTTSAIHSIPQQITITVLLDSSQYGRLHEGYPFELGSDWGIGLGVLLVLAMDLALTWE